MTPINLKNSSSNANYLNFNGSAKELTNQLITPVSGNISDIYKDFIVLEKPVVIVNAVSVESLDNSIPTKGR